MNLRSLVLATAPAAVLVLAVPAFAAADKCAVPDGAAIQTNDAIKAKAEGLGYTVRKVGTEDGCIEVKGFDKTGARVELYFNPASGDLVNTKVD